MDKDTTVMVELFLYCSETGCESSMNGKKKYLDEVGTTIIYVSWSLIARTDSYRSWFAKTSYGQTGSCIGCL